MGHGSGSWRPAQLNDDPNPPLKRTKPLFQDTGHRTGLVSDQKRLGVFGLVTGLVS